MRGVISSIPGQQIRNVLRHPVDALRVVLPSGVARKAGLAALITMSRAHPVLLVTVAAIGFGWWYSARQRSETDQADAADVGAKAGKAKKPAPSRSVRAKRASRASDAQPDEAKGRGRGAKRAAQGPRGKRSPSAEGDEPDAG